MPVKNPSTTLRAGIIPGQTVTKEKLQRAKELRRDMTPAEKIVWQELRGNKVGVHLKRPDRRRTERSRSVSSWRESIGLLCAALYSVNRDSAETCQVSAGELC